MGIGDDAATRQLWWEDVPLNRARVPSKGGFAETSGGAATEREDDYSIPECRMQRCGVDIALPRGRSNRFMQKRRALPRLLRAPLSSGS